MVKTQNTPHTSCLFCGSREYTVLTLPYTDIPGKKMQYHSFSCCGYYVQRAFLSGQQMKSLYKNDYHVFRHEGMALKKRKLFARLKAHGFTKYITNKHILEIGAGTGDFLAQCAHYSPRTMTGIELSSDAVIVAKKRYGLSLTNVNIETHALKKKFDTIFLFHVIEHLKDPVKLLKKLEGLLLPGGVIIAETPNIHSWEYSLFNEKWLNLSVPFHTFLFSPHSLIKLGKQSSLTCEKVIHGNITNVFPDQFLRIQKRATTLFYIPLFMVYELWFFVSALFRRSGVITVIFSRTSTSRRTSA